jgi:hypothetical protein
MYCVATFESLNPTIRKSEIPYNSQPHSNVLNLFFQRFPTDDRIAVPQKYYPILVKASVTHSFDFWKTAQWVNTSCFLSCFWCLYLIMYAAIPSHIVSAVSISSVVVNGVQTQTSYIVL